jgi:hypothetical protein
MPRLQINNLVYQNELIHSLTIALYQFKIRLEKFATEEKPLGNASSLTGVPP